MILSFKTKAGGKPTSFPEKIKSSIKIHSIRPDAGNRWEAGKTIHFATGVRTKHYNQFHTDTCKGTQKIEMEFYSALNCLPVTIWIDDRELTDEEVIELAKNDGFDQVEDFLNFFRKDFSGKLIHWTNHTY